MKRISLLILAFGLLTFTSCKKDEPQDDNAFDTTLVKLLEESNDAGKAFFQMPDAKDLASIPQDPKNPLTEEKVILGQMLFHETAIMLNAKEEITNGTVSCASCHFAQGGFAACLPQGIGDGGMGFGETGEGRVISPLFSEAKVDVQPVKTPSVMNTAYQPLMLWNGTFGGVLMNIGTELAWKEGTPMENNHLGFHGIETQAIAGLEVHRMKIDPDFIDSTEYKALFDEAFPEVDIPERYSRLNAALAIAAYERSLLANEAPFQKWLAGDNEAMNSTEKQGAIVFFGKGGCVECHTGPTLNSMTFHSYGMDDLYVLPGVLRADPDASANLGRGGFTGRPADMFKFKTPQLYNLADSPFYGHGSSFNSIKEVVEYKNEALPQNTIVIPSQLSSSFVSLNLTKSEIESLTIFLKTGLRDPNLMRYVPSAVPSGNCFPNNDPLSKIDMGCD